MKNEKRNTTKVKILDASKNLFYMHGYKNTRIDMISEITDIPKSLINYHFPKKQDILIVIMKDFLEEVYEYVLSSLHGDYLTKYFVFNKIYYNAFHIDFNTLRFHKEVLVRKDRSIEAYKNFEIIYNDINNIMKLNISKENLTIKEVAIFGSNQELLLNYYKGIIDIGVEKVIELNSVNTCKILGVPNIIINEHLQESRVIYKSMDVSHLYIFHQGE